MNLDFAILENLLNDSSGLQPKVRLAQLACTLQQLLHQICHSPFHKQKQALKALARTVIPQLFALLVQMEESVHAHVLKEELNTLWHIYEAVMKRYFDYFEEEEIAQAQGVK